MNCPKCETDFLKVFSLKSSKKSCPVCDYTLNWMDEGAVTRELVRQNRAATQAEANQKTMQAYKIRTSKDTLPQLKAKPIKKDEPEDCKVISIFSARS